MPLLKRRATVGLKQRLCDELGWSIDQDDGSSIRLDFKGDDISRQRSIHVTGEEDGPFLSLLCICSKEFTLETVPYEMWGALLVRNDALHLGTWYSSIDGNDVIFAVRYTALTAGLNANTFKYLCNNLLEEMTKFEQGLLKKGLL